MNKNQKGFSVVEGLIILAVLGVIVFAGNFVMGKNKHAKPAVASVTTTPTLQQESEAAGLVWQQTATGYQPNGTIPTCVAPMIKQFPAEISKVTSVLYPGQYRGGNYKPHGGLRFDKSANDEITVKAPFDGTLIDGGAYIADGTDNDVQYTFDVMNNCGMMYRVGHLLTLSAQLQSIASKFPAAVKGDSRTTNIKPALKIQAGTVLATAVGTASGKNVFFDLGVYDWRRPNMISTFPAWLNEAQHNTSLAKHAICWFDQLNTKDKATIKTLPAGDPTSGKTSDYCK